MASRSDEEFLLQIGRDPFDAGVKRVFCDWLLERGDPRGELMALQLKAHRTDDDRSREQLLLKVHLDRWLPPQVLINLDRASIVFEQGVLTAARVAVQSPSALVESLTHPVWATVRALAAAPPELLPSCPWLEALTEVDDATVSALRDPLPRLTTLGVLGRAPQVLARAFGSAAFANVRTLSLGMPLAAEPARELEPERLGWLFDGPLQLERLVLHTGWVDLQPWLLCIERAKPVLQLTPMVFAATNWWIRFDPHRTVVVHPGSDLNEAFSEGPVREILSTAPRGFFRRLEIPQHLGWQSVRRLVQ